MSNINIVVTRRSIAVNWPSLLDSPAIQTIWASTEDFCPLGRGMLRSMLFSSDRTNEQGFEGQAGRTSLGNDVNNRSGQKWTLRNATKQELSQSGLEVVQQSDN